MDKGTVGQSCIRKLLLDRVYNGQSWFGYSPRWTELSLGITFGRTL